jgi:hypothetical protein
MFRIAQGNGGKDHVFHNEHNYEYVFVVEYLADGKVLHDDDMSEEEDAT